MKNYCHTDGSRQPGGDRTDRHKIEISKLDETDLVELNLQIVARLRYLEEARTHHQMLSENVGDRVRFHPPGHEPKTGVVVKYNRKTVTVITDDRYQWNVAPVLLSRVIDAARHKKAATALKSCGCRAAVAGRASGARWDDEPLTAQRRR